MKQNRKKLPREVVAEIVKKYIVLTIANFILAIVATLFLSPLNIVSGGLTGIAIVIDNLIQHIGGVAESYLDIIMYCGEALLLIVSFIFLGKSTTLKSLYSCIIYPSFVVLLTRVFNIESVVNILYNNGADVVSPVMILIGAVAGGIGTGLAVALSFSVGGSTGGIDTIVLIIMKHTKRLKESVVCFMVDASIIVVGTIEMLVWNSFGGEGIVQAHLILMMMNVVSALIGSAVVEFVYLSRNSSVVVSINSSKWEEINTFIQDELDRGSTIYDCEGGYTLSPRKEIKTVINKKEYQKTLEGIQKIDSKAFITFTVTKHVLGQGFTIEKYND